MTPGEGLVSSPGAFFQSRCVSSEAERQLVTLRAAGSNPARIASLACSPSWLWHLILNQAQRRFDSGTGHSFLTTWRNGRRSRSRACRGLIRPQLGVRVSPSALFLSFGDMRMVPRPVCKTGARSEHWRSDSSVTDRSKFVARLRSSIGQSKRLLPVRFQVQLLAGAPLLTPVGLALQNACFSSTRPSVGNRHGRPRCRRGGAGRRITPRT